MLKGKCQANKALVRYGVKRERRLCFVVQISLVLLVALSAKALSPKQQWVERYNGPGNKRDCARAITIDDSGNIYVTGESDGTDTERDYCTVKYDANGVQLWTARYNGPANDYDDAHDIAVDNLGNVYVTGSDNDDVTAWDYATVKYDPNGNQLWVVRYSSAGWEHDSANAIALDDYGNVYVTGTSSLSYYEYDCVTFKYDQQGNEVWRAAYHEPNRGNFANDITLDDAGNVYVGGSSGIVLIGASNNDYLTIKYDNNGKQTWVAKHDPTIGCGGGGVNALAVDNTGNVYVTGSVDIDGIVGPEDDRDYCTIKYGPSGNLLWEANYNGPGNGCDRVRGIVVDESGYSYVTGYSDGTDTGADYATIKYGPYSNEPLWVARYNGPANGSDQASAITLDNDGNVYITGRSYGGSTSFDYATIKYGPDGNEPMWVARYNNDLENGTDDGWAIAVDHSGNVYVTGESRGSDTRGDYATVKYIQPVCESPVEGDLDKDCKVDFGDFSILGNQWRQPPGSPSADIAPEVLDNFVDILDLAVLCEHWLECNLEPPDLCWE